MGGSCNRWIKFPAPTTHFIHTYRVVKKKKKKVADIEKFKRSFEGTNNNDDKTRETEEYFAITRRAVRAHSVDLFEPSLTGR